MAVSKKGVLKELEVKASNCYLIGIKKNLNFTIDTFILQTTYGKN